VSPLTHPEFVASWNGHVIMCGLHDEGLRVVEQLQGAGVDVVVVDDSPDPKLVHTLDELGVPYLAADARLPETLAAAGIGGAAALICAESDDLHTLATALLCRELRPELRVVVQMRNPAVGRALEAVGVAVLDVAGLAAPTFVDSCLGTAVRALTLGPDEFVVVETATARSGSLRELYGDLAPLAVIPADGSPVVTTPGRDVLVAAGDTVVLVGAPEAVKAAGLVEKLVAPVERVYVSARGPRPAASRTGRAALVSTLARSLDRRLKTALGALLGLISLSVTVLMIGYREPSGGRMSVVDALYFTVETVGTVGFGDFYFRDQNVWLRIWAIALMLVGATLATLFFALLTNMLVSRRIAESLGLRKITGLTDHVVVIGAGAVGVAIAAELHQRGRLQVAIDSDEENRFLGRFRALGIPVVVADATLPETLRSARLDQARAVAVVTSSDLVNIETGLAVRDLLGDRWSEVPVVLRLFDRRLARTVGSGFDFHYVRSPAALAAPWFVGAALGLDVMETFYVGDQPLLLAHLKVAVGGGLDGVAMQELPARVRVISLVRKTDAVRVPPRRATTLAGGDEMYLIGPYEELIRLLRSEA
jgi:Trk K+ transport system NAD-binding subunit